MTSTHHRILVVDDSQAIHETMRAVLSPPREVSNALDELEAELFGDRGAAAPLDETPIFELAHATQGQQALTMLTQALAEDRPFALAFIDMRMPPGWDGLQTIEALWAEDPALHVVICTAYSDHSWTEIRRRLGNSKNLLVLQKPFDPVELQQVAFTMTHKWEAEAAEKELLERTLGGTVGMIGDLLTLSAPSAAGRARNVQALVAHAAEQLGLTHWAYPLAAGLSQVGCLMLPDEVVAHERSGRELEPKEGAMFLRHPKLGARLVAQIPRLELVAKIIGRQLGGAPAMNLDRADETDERFIVAAGTNLLVTALGVDQILNTGVTAREAVERCHLERKYNPDILDAMASYEPAEHESWVEDAVPLGQLKVGMILQEPVTTGAGVIVCPASTRITLPLLERLINFAVRVGVTREFRVKMPAPPEATATG